MSTTYSSQQDTVRNTMIAYLQDTSNWSDGVPRLTDFSEGSIIYTLLSAVSVVVDTLGMAILMSRLAAYCSTATSTDLDNKVADYGLTRKSAVAASGDFTFYKNNAATSAITISAGSTISTVPDSSSDVITFATDDDATLAIGDTEVTVSCTCQTTGSSGNISSGTSLLISSSIPGIDGVTLSTTLTGGDDAETDDSLRARGLAVFTSLARGTAASYKETVLAIDGIESAVVVSQNRGAGTVDIFVTGASNSIPSDTVLAEAQEAIDDIKIATDDVLVTTPDTITINATITVTLESGYGSTTLTSVQTAIEEYIENLGVGAGIYGYVYASQLISTALTITGVLNATTTFTDTAVASNYMPEPGTITVTTA